MSATAPVQHLELTDDVVTVIRQALSKCIAERRATARMTLFATVRREVLAQAAAYEEALAALPVGSSVERS